MDYIPVKKAADNWGVSERWVQVMCENGRIDGVFKFGRSWLIPKDAERPKDARVKSGKYVKR